MRNAAVIDSVAGDLARRGHQLGLVDDPKASFNRPRSNSLPHADDIVRGAHCHISFFSTTTRDPKWVIDGSADQGQPLSTFSAVRTPVNESPVTRCASLAWVVSGWLLGQIKPAALSRRRANP
jgi:hypothetical protein